MKKDYITNKTEILFSRSKTVGISMNKFNYKNKKIEINDFGAHRNERIK